jgi:hypothetical protein
MCIKACPHDARDYVDDTAAFLKDLKDGRRYRRWWRPLCAPIFLNM